MAAAAVAHAASWALAILSGARPIVARAGSIMMVLASSQPLGSQHALASLLQALLPHPPFQAGPHSFSNIYATHQLAQLNRWVDPQRRYRNELWQALRSSAPGLPHLRYLWLPKWIGTAEEQLHQWQAELQAGPMPLLTIRTSDLSHAFRMHTPVGCCDEPDCLEWWKLSPWNLT